jgi:hypothetical protein
MIDNIQYSVNWSRFLGELFAYSIIERKRLTKLLLELLNMYRTDPDKNCFERALKCICTSLLASKEYLLKRER